MLGSFDGGGLAESCVTTRHTPEMQLEIVEVVLALQKDIDYELSVLKECPLTKEEWAILSNSAH